MSNLVVSHAAHSMRIGELSTPRGLQESRFEGDEGGLHAFAITAILADAARQRRK